MVKVCVWHPRGANVGHSSVKIRGQYFSYWPAIGVTGAKDAMTFQPSTFVSWDVDKASEGGHAQDETIILNNLDENAMLVFFNWFVAKKPDYHLKYCNCSHPVKIALYEGSQRRPPNFKVVASSAYTLPLPPHMAGGRTEAWIRETWNPLEIGRYANYLKSVIG